MTASPKSKFLKFFTTIIVTILIFMLRVDLNISMETNPIQVKSSTDNELVLQLHSPQYSIENKEFQNESFSVIQVPGFQQTSLAGKPQLPVKGFLFGIPAESSVNWKVISSESIPIDEHDIYITPKIMRNLPSESIPKNMTSLNFELKEYVDQSIMSRDRFYPDDFIEIDTSAYMRDNRVGRLLFYPVQFNPVSKELRWVKNVTVRINFVHRQGLAKEPGSPREKITAFDNILQNSLLNYDLAKTWKKESQQLSPADLFKNTSYNLGVETWFKIIVDTDGIHHIQKTELENAGLDLNNVNPQHIQVFNRGNEIAIFIHGEQDSVFDESDYIEFYGEATKNNYTYDNIYWLKVGSSPGCRMFQKNGNIEGTFPVVTRGLSKKYYETNKMYYANIPNGENEDHWVWEFLSAPADLNMDFYAKDVVNIPSLPANFSIELRGYTHTVSNPDHHTIVYLNGNKIFDEYWDGQSVLHGKSVFLQGFLNEGNNQLTINQPGDTDAIVDQVMLNWFEIDYWRNFRANNDFAYFKGREEPATYQFEVSNFSTDQIFIFDITNPDSVLKISNFDVHETVDNYKIIFQDQSSNRNYLALTSAHIKTAKEIVQDEPSQLRSANNQADYLIITHEQFYDNLASLANFRQNQNLNVITAKINDVYDEFNFGIKDPQAIKNFLSYAYFHWRKPSPTYVLLVGDASYDFKNYLGDSHPDLMPTHLFESNAYHTETSSDNWFVCVSGPDILPDMLIGRLPVRSGGQLDGIISKLIKYENNPSPGDWNKNIMFVSDNADGGGNFEQLSDHLADNYVSPDYNTSKVYLRDYESNYAIREAVVNNINNGCLITNYLGHGSLDYWSHERFFHSEHIELLNNRDSFPLIVTMSCMNGYFQHAREEQCLGEAFISAQSSGSIACFSPSGFGYTIGDQYLGEGLYTAFFTDKDFILGSAIAKAKITLYSIGSSFYDHVEFFHLFGDPATNLNIRPEEISVNSNWNLISLPRQPENPQVDSVLANLNGNWSKLMAYKNGVWLAADTQVPSDFWTLTEMTTNLGYWLQTTDAGQIINQGMEKSNIIPLSVGWNLIGYPSPEDKNISDALQSIEGNWSKILYYKQEQWFGADNELPKMLWTIDELKSGNGYWLKMSNEDTLYISRIPDYNESAPQGNNTGSNNEIKQSTTKFEKMEITQTTNLNNNYKLSVPMPSGYYGRVTVRDRAAPVGTVISAWINNVKYLPVMQVKKPGIYNLLMVSGDDPQTYIIEGGKSRELVEFRIELPSGEILFSDTKGFWEEGINQRLDLFSLSTIDSSQQPVEISLKINDRIFGEDVISGDPISVNSQFSILIYSGEYRILPENIQLIQNTNIIDNSNYSIATETEPGNYTNEINYQLIDAQSGMNEFKIIVNHPGMVPNEKILTFTFKISSELEIEKVVNFPNPMNATTKFTYYLLNDVSPEINIKIYTVSGRLIKVIEQAGNDVGYNETFWDGTDDFGDEIANGVYFYKIQAKDGSKRKEIIEKLIKMK